MSRFIISAIAVSGVALAAMAVAGTRVARLEADPASALVVVPATAAPQVAGKTAAAVSSSPASATVAPAVALSTSKASVQVVRPVEAAARLLPLDLRDMRLWNWNGTWHASEWSNSESPIPWKYNHVVQLANGDTRFILDAQGSPQLQAQKAMPTYARGLWESDVTLPPMRDGMIVAPLWISDPVSKDEVDFEYAGRKGLDVTLHGNTNGVLKSQTVRLFAGRDMSGERHRFGIRVDNVAGTVDMFFDGKRVHRWSKSSMTFWISQPMKPWIHMWASDPKNSGFVAWTGSWAGIGANESLVMTVHGYGYKPIP